jgi:GcrA cell cycle regulator
MASPHSRVWNDERVEQLKRLHAEGLSCSLIAAKLGCGLSRNSIIGKLHRIGLRSIRPGVTKERPTPHGRRRSLQPVANLFHPGETTVERAQPSCSLNDAEGPLNQRRTLVELGQRDCRWSYDDPDASDFSFLWRSYSGWLALLPRSLRAGVQSATATNAEDQTSLHLTPVETTNHN